jgi:hypothetical protein
MKHMRFLKCNKNRLPGFVISLMAGTAFIHASPEISVDTATYDLGIIYEGKMPSATHVFKVKNTGDSTLFIKQVKPG